MADDNLEETGPDGGQEAPMVDSKTEGTERVSTLRGAGVDVDSRLVGRILIYGSMVILLVLVIVFFQAGVRKNAQINDLRQHGVPVIVTSTGCLGLMGGSGSNAAGYQCRGTFVLDGSHYSENIPGDTLYPPGSTFHAVVVPGDPALLTPADSLPNEHTSLKVFLLPAILLLILVMLAVFLIVWRRRASQAERTAEPGTAGQ